MRYTYDNDLHIHTHLSLCSNDPEQNTERILAYAKENHLKNICVTDHFWDETVEGAMEWYKLQNFPHVAKSLPLPQGEGIRFMFGCETEMDKYMRLGISRKTVDKFDFVVIPTTHFHMTGFTLTDEQAKTSQSRAKAWVDRLDCLLSMDLPFHKIGIAHLTCCLIAPESDEDKFVEIMEAIPEEDMVRLFRKAAKLGVGIELNGDDMKFSEKTKEATLRPYRIAKACGCKFYMGSDAHHPKELLDTPAYFERAIDLLGLEESDKFIVP